MLIRDNVIKSWSSLVLICVLLVSLYSTPVEAVEVSNRDRIIVSLGDSYSSGEGIEPFYGSDKELSEKVKDLDWLSHRSTNSWPGMLRIPGVDGTMAENRDEHWYFAAVSGAKIKHVVSKNQKKTYVKHYTKTGNAYRGGKKAVVATYSDTVKLDKQIDIFDQLAKEGKKADYVTITIGGNDADFGGIITKIVTGSAFLDISGLSNKIYDTWGEFYKKGGIRDQLREAYNLIAEKAGPQATILVAGYPRLLNKNGNGSVITKKEAEIVNRAVTLFNYAIEDVVNECRIQDKIDVHFVSVEEEFGDNGAYTDETIALINEVIFSAQEEDINDSKITSDYSMHPNYKGACTYANCVQKKINELEGNNNGNLSFDSIYGEWFNLEYDSHEAWATSYKVTFNEDGTVIHEGYRDTNKGIYTIFEALDIIVASFDENYHVWPGEGKTREDYTFEIVYEIVDDGLCAVYSSEYFGNANDGLFVRNSELSVESVLKKMSGEDELKNQAKSEPTVSQIIFERICEDEQEYAFVKGVDADKETVWTYRSEKVEQHPFDYVVQEIGENNKIFYFMLNGNLLALSKENGQLLWENNTCEGNVGFRYAFDENDVLYLCAEFDSCDFAAIDANGKTLKHITQLHQEYCWPYELQYKSGKVAVTLDCFEVPEDRERGGHICIIDTKDFSYYFEESDHKH